MQQRGALQVVVVLDQTLLWRAQLYSLNHVAVVVVVAAVADYDEMLRLTWWLPFQVEQEREKNVVLNSATAVATAAEHFKRPQSVCLFNEDLK